MSRPLKEGLSLKSFCRRHQSFLSSVLETMDLWKGLGLVDASILDVKILPSAEGFLNHGELGTFLHERNTSNKVVDNFGRQSRPSSAAAMAKNTIVFTEQSCTMSLPDVGSAGVWMPENFLFQGGHSKSQSHLWSKGWHISPFDTALRLDREAASRRCEQSAVTLRESFVPELGASNRPQRPESKDDK